MLKFNGVYIRMDMINFDKVMETFYIADNFC